MKIWGEIRHHGDFGIFKQFFYDNFRLKGKFQILMVQIYIYQSLSYFKFNQYCKIVKYNYLKFYENWLFTYY